MPLPTTVPHAHSPRPVDLRLYAILDPERSRGRSLAELAVAAIAGGVTLLQYRDKHADTRSYIDNTRTIMAAIAGKGVPLLINDRVDVALAGGANGVHIGQDDMAPVDARLLLGPDAIIGLTLNNSQEAQAAAHEPIDYGCIGGVFATSSKDNPKPPIGLTGLACVVESARQYCPHLPVGAIAGINDTNAASIIGTGVGGIAVISAILMAEDVTQAARSLRTIVDTSLAAYGQGTAGAVQ